MADDAADASFGGHSAERKVPFEMSGTVSDTERLGARPQVVRQLHGPADERALLGAGGQPASSQLTDLGHLILAGARGRLLTKIVDTLGQGTQFAALTGVAGVGKTMMATAIREELSKRSVSVRWVDGGGGGGIRLRTIMAQVLTKPETDIDDGDIEQLFDAMTEREAPIQRLVLIVDDAERLLPDAIGYLRLLASVAMERMPQVLFVGAPSFWDTADRAAQAGFEDLIRARFELEPLSPREASAAAQRLISALSPARRPVFERDALEAVVQRAGGLISHLFPLVAAIEAIARETDQNRVTTVVIDAAAAKLEGAPLAPPSAGNSETATPALILVHTTPEDGCGEATGATRARRRWQWNNARMSGAAAALAGSLGMAIYWLSPFSIDQIRAEARTALEQQDVGGSVSSDTMIIVRLPVSVRTQHAELNTPNYDGAITTQAIAARVEEVWPRTFSGPPIGTSVAVRRPAPSKGIVETRPEPSIYVTRASKGIWLFPSNPNG